MIQHKFQIGQKIWHVSYKKLPIMETIKEPIPKKYEASKQEYRFIKSSFFPVSESDIFATYEEALNIMIDRKLNAIKSATRDIINAEKHMQILLAELRKKEANRNDL